ncbi:hypothetical protein [Chryseobacterium gregarium]|uniref:hypothetical protein n=1 Tax=Chryseobacterium gregarium TaxID=456299 RepID=UPI00041488A7|nr:hypothetical protein [Chryseobacterium gregarium]
MEPVTAIAIASFVYSLYSSFSKRASGDPIDAMVAMLVEMNKKLSIINDKLDIIYDTVVQLPDKVEYTRRINDLIVVSSRMPVLYNKLQADIATNKSDVKGKAEFIRKNSQDVNSYLSDIRKSMQVLKKETDILTIAMLCNAAQNDFELCKLINVSPQDIKIEQTEYLKYLKSAIWTDPACLDIQLAGSTTTIESIRSDSFIADWRFKVCIQEAAHEDPAQYNNERRLNMHKPKFNPIVFDNEKKTILNNLSLLGYIDTEIFSQLSSYEPSTVTSIPSGYDKNVFVLKKTIRFKNQDKPRITDIEHINNAVINNYINAKASLYSSEQNNLLALSSVHNLAISTIKYINFRIS